MGKIISIANQKGGVGKTTTSVNLAAGLAKLGKNILVVDADPQGNTTSGLGVNKREVKTSIYDVLINDLDMQDVIIATGYKNLSLCPSHIKLAGAELELVSLIAREYQLKNSIAPIKDRYDFIIVDCPPSLGLITLNALSATETIIIPIQCEYYALEGLSQLTATIKQIKKALNPLLDIEGVLLTMFDSRTNLSIQVVDEVKKFFPHKVYKTVIPRNVRISEAPSFGKPVIYYDPRSKGADSYIDLAKEVISQNGG